MKRICMAAILVLITFGARAQQFEEKFRIDLPDSLEHARVQWVDLDNDGLLDALVTGKSGAGLPFLLTYKMDTIQGLLFRTSMLIPAMESAFVLVDEDLDNDIDILLSGDSAGQVQSAKLANMGDFSFKSERILEQGGALAIGDLDEDGTNELVVSGIDAGVPFVRIYTKVASHWEVRHDSIFIASTSLSIRDLDGDGRNDLFISGRDTIGSPRTTIFYNRGRWYFKAMEIPNAIDGTASLGDIDEDGDFDILMSGKNAVGGNRALTLLNVGDSVRVITDTLTVFEKLNFFVADLNSNGLCDIHALGFQSSVDTLNAIILDDSTRVSMSGHGLVDRAFGDFDRDGDLDMLQVLRTPAGHNLVIYDNTVDAVNGYPSRVRLPLALAIFNRTLIYFEQAEDDHTPSNAITYDLALQAELEERMVGEFDLFEGTRLTVSHGNMGTNNFLLLKDAFPAFTYSIQSVDNSFHTGADSLCVGSGSSGAGQGCDLISIDTIDACRNEQLVLGNGSEASWFSFTNGFLGRFSNFNIVAAKSDTLFSVAANRSSDCGAVKVYLIQVQEKIVKKIESGQFVCEGKALEFGVEPGWDQVTWSSVSSGFLSNEDSIVFSTFRNDTLIATVSNSTGCTIQRRLALKISKPEVTMNGEVIHIVKGGSAQLDAGPGGTAYQWVPSGSLSDDRVSNPVATPSVTTEYTVTVTDSIGCTAQGKILVIVEETAFAPNLFTPNGDGKNDDFRLFGLSAVKDFAFTIRNREGSIVYETRDPSSAMVTGWNGQVRGTVQPSGVYFWHVQGQHPSGTLLLLNGKNSGTIVLIR